MVRPEGAELRLEDQKAATDVRYRRHPCCEHGLTAMLLSLPQESADANSDIPVPKVRGVRMHAA